VRWRADGELAFLGRLDHQVKLRGFRIELGEIEAVLAEHPAVGRAVVVARNDRFGHTRLIAYVEAGDEAVDSATLRTHLRRVLPEYMVPSSVEILDGFPLTPNRKVDRLALPEPNDADAARPYEPPRTPTEEAVAQIWADVLGRERIGIHDSFFDLGGHSLLAMRMMAQIRDVFETELPVRALFEQPSLAAFCENLLNALLDGVDDDDIAELAGQMEQVE
jgi:acyl carrier protein